MFNDLANRAQKEMLQKIEAFFMERLNFESGDKRLVCSKIYLPDSNEFNGKWRAQNEAKIMGKSHKSVVRADLKLFKGDKLLDEKRAMSIASIPTIFNRGTFIIKGTEYSLPMQKRLISGVYTSKTDDGNITAWVNTSSGINMKVTLRDKGDFILDISNSTINLLAVLVGLGIDVDRIKKEWGDEVFGVNIKARGARDIKQALAAVYDRLQYDKTAPAPQDATALKEWILDYMSSKTAIDEDNTAMTLRNGYSQVTPEMFMDCTHKILAVASGAAKQDNKESLIHNKISDGSDFFIERMNSRQYRGSISRALVFGMKRFNDIRKIVPKSIFDKPIETTLTQTAVARSPKQNNPMDILSNFTEVTVRGEGGIMDLHQVKRDVRAVDPTHFGLLDPIHTPEGSNIGTTVHIATGAVKIGDTLYLEVQDKKGGFTKLNPKEIFKSRIMFPEYREMNGKVPIIKPDKTGTVKVMHRGEITRVTPENVDYILRTETDLFDINSMAIPFLSHNNGTRAMTGAKMQSQAKPLKYREAPLVQCALNKNTDKTIEQVIGDRSVVKSPVDGKVVSVADGLIMILPQGEKKAIEVDYPHNFWLNEDNYIDSEVLVKAGDSVSKGQRLTENIYTDNGVMALGTNLRTAFVPYKGYNYEDGVVVSESGAKKLTSLHSKQISVPYTTDEILDLKKYRSYFPVTFTSDQLSKLDADGIIKKGETVNYGDPLVVKLREVEEDTLSKQLKSISRLLTQDYRDMSVSWEKTTPGVVAEVRKRRSDIFVVVKTEEKAKVGDKIVGRYGNKGTITTILSDDEMPRDEDGNVMDLLLNPNGVVSRMNLGQIIETTVSTRLATKEKPFVAKPFGGDHVRAALKDLKKAKKKDYGRLFDPTTETWIDGVNHGKQYILKLEHQVEKKLSARGAGVGERYSDTTGQPARGGGTGGQAVGLMETYALLSHGADSNLGEMFSFKGNKNLEAWRAIENGTFLPPPDVPESSKRFVSMLKGMGVNLVEEGKNVKMVPFLDKDVEEISNGQIKDAVRLRAKDLKEEKGGIFDLAITGGIVGENYSHFELAEPLPHPTFEKTILDVLHITKNELYDIISGNKGLDKDSLELKHNTSGDLITGGHAIKKMLSSIDMKKRLEYILKTAPSKKGTDLNKLNREGRILKNFIEQNRNLEDLVVTKIPIIPPKYRGIIEMPNGSLTVADINEHYTAAILMNNHLKEFVGRPGLIDEKNKASVQMYEALKGISGYSQGLVQKPNVKGFADTIAGSSPKYGHFLSRMLSRRQDVSARGVVGPDPKLDMDELGIPEKIAWKTFSPFIVKELKGFGFTSIRAKNEIEKQSPIARKALQDVMEKKHVFMNRAPTLHDKSFMAFKPKLVPGAAIRVPIEITAGYGMDFDGDTVAIHVAVTDAANAEASEMLPSKNLRPTGYKDKISLEMGHEYTLGVYKLSKEGKRVARKFNTPEQVIDAFNTKKIVFNDVVQVAGIGNTTAGRCLLMAPVPKSVRVYDKPINGGLMKKIINESEKVGGRHVFKNVMTTWKHLGRQYAFTTGSSFILSDLDIMSDKRNKLYEEADKKVMQIVNGPGDINSKRNKILGIYSKVDSEIIGSVKSLKINSTGKTNNISDMVNAGARGNPDQVKQLVGNLGLMLDHRQRTMQEPVRGNMGEGLSSSDFFAHSYAQRKGMIDKSQSVSGPGQLSKELNVTAIKQVVSMVDCHTSRGRKERVDSGILDRLLLKPTFGFAKDTIITDDVIRGLEKKGIKEVEIRSLFTCEADHGICAKCYGLDVNGSLPPVGKRIGLKEIQAITERTTQLPMKSFHTGGVASAESGLSDAFSRALQILNIPDNITNKATLATVTGRVSTIRKSAYGGFDITIGGKIHKIPEGLALNVKEGDFVQKGDKISGGIIKPQDLLELKGVEAVQKQMRDDLKDTFLAAGIKLTPRTYEFPIKMITENVRITNPGGNKDMLPGDYSTLPKVLAWNKANPNLPPIKYQSDLLGVRAQPHKGTDWVQRMSISRIKQTISEGVSQGMHSTRGDSTDASPLANLALGKNTRLK